MDGLLRKIYRDMQYGFIDAEGKSYFFHKSDFNGEWGTLCTNHERGEPIYMEFRATNTDKGPRAREVKLSDV